MLTRRPHQRGMSLVELMVGVTITALLLVMAVPSVGSAIQNRQLRSAADGIQTGLSTARTEALRRNRNVKFTLTPGTSSYTVGCETPDLTTDATTGEVLCPDSIQVRDQQENSSRALVATSQQLGAGGAASSTTFTNTLSFTPLGRTTSATLPAGNVAVFDITSPTGTCAASGGDMRCLRVVVSAAGQIRMCDPAATSSTDPRKC